MKILEGTPPTERDALLVQIRGVNEQLLLATLRADVAVADANAANQTSADLAEREAKRRYTAEEITGKLLASEHARLVTARAKDEFLAMLGHELRNPLAPILIALDVIAARDPTAFPRERAVIERQVKHLTRLVDDLLDVSRIASGKIELRLELVELGTVVARAVELASPLLEAKHHHLDVDVPEHGLLINADPVRFAQIVSNLIVNAAKYTPDGGLVAVAGDVVGEDVRVRVRDNGIGISEAMLPTVFELFAQESQALDRAPGGLGLGLAIVRSLVTSHGGSVTASSGGSGRGSEFEVLVPCVNHLRDSAAPALPETTPLRAPPLRLLVVDDNRDIAELMGDVLGVQGHDVRVAFDGPSALAICATFTPDVALLDIGLPVMDGYELAAKLRAALPGVALKLIAITGYGQLADKQRASDAGFALHLVKPVDMKTLEAGLISVTTLQR